MAGHSKWANIQHRKGAQDKKRAKVFTKLIRDITTAAKIGGKNPEMNPRLRLAISKATTANLPKDSLEKAIKRGAGELEGVEYQDILYEGYGPGGSALLIECLTDNHVRTIAEIRHIFSKNNGKIGTENSVAYLFEKKGYLFFDDLTLEDQLYTLAIEFSVDDICTVQDGIQIITNPHKHYEIVEQFSQEKFNPVEEGIRRAPLATVDLSNEDIDSNSILIDKLEDNNDVQEVYSNINF